MKGMSETVSTASNAADAWTNPLRDPRDLRLPRIAGPCSIVIFGVTGDLSRKKLLPAIYDLANRGLLPPSFGLTGFARRDWTEDHFKDFVKENVQAHCRTPFKESTWKQLAAGIRFVQGTFDDPKAFERLSDTVAELDRDRGTRGNHAFYMSVPPRAFPQVSRQLADCGLAKSDKGAWRRVIIEKPFGHDLASAKELDRVVSEVFDPSSVFRIDHYLGKETVQNMLALRFANAMYEPIWNNNYVDHVQITMAEDIGVAGRAGYYDGIGAARDIIQNHLLQLMALTAMEEPVSFSAADLTAEKTKVLSAVRLPKDLAAHTARGQYAAGWQGSHEVVGYLDEKGIDPASTTETYAAIRLDVDTRRWAGVPFYLRTGKRLGKRVTEIAVIFKRAPHLPFESTATKELGKNAIVIRVQPDEGVTMRFGSKVPGGTSMEVRDVSMDFGYGRSFTESSPEAYERLILDVLLGDPPLFPTTREVELSWQILDPIEEFWSTLGQPQPYRSGTWGPEDAVIITLQDTETREISAKIDELHEERGEAALGRVLTLLISTNEAELEHDLEVANNASREHPCRVIAVAPSSRKISPEEEHPTFLDAEIRFGSDAGAGEIIVLRPRGGLVRHADTLVIPLLVPDAPVVAWWPNEAPANLSKDLLGSMASSRITDAMHSSNPRRTMDDLRRNRSAKDVDMSWTRLTVWRAMIASMLDQPPHLPVSNVRVTGQKDYLPLDLLAAWLRLRLNVPVMIEEDPNATAVTGVYLTRGDGVLSLERPSTDDGFAVISVPGQSPQTISVPARTLEECLSEELGRLYPDEIYSEVVSQGLDLVKPRQ